MNNKTDFLGINSKNFIDSFDIFGDVMTHIINSSMIQGTFPSTWKETVIKTIPKVGKPKVSSEYRPINMNSVYEKILEKVISLQFEKYINDNNILCDEQSGFRGKYSCETALNLVLHDLKRAKEDGLVVVAVFLDFKRAFETVDREILLLKLKKYGVINKELNWFKTFLEDRKQKSLVNSVYSHSNNVNIGVPQGAILGVLTFLLYINDIKETLKFCKIILFADDALIYIVGRNFDECWNKINSDLNELYNWLCMNKLQLNLEKTKWMLFNDRAGNRENLSIGGGQIERVGFIKYLGVQIDEKLDINQHADYISAKVSKKIGYLARIRNQIT